MGVIRVKLANNYRTDPILAADDYFQTNRVVKLVSPDSKIIPGSWKMSSDVPLQFGFGAYAKLNSGGYWGFTVCFLKNQQTGVTELYEKHLSTQNFNGDISPEYYAWWEAGNAPTLTDFNISPASGFVSEFGTFVHPAYLAVAHLNEISVQDQMNIDFVYPSPIHQDQPNFYFNDTNTNIIKEGGLGARTQQTSQRGKDNVPGLTLEKNEGFGAYGDNPWPKCSMTSFFETQAFNAGNEEDINNDMRSSILSCSDEQAAQWDEQWSEILSGPGPA